MKIAKNDTRSSNRPISPAWVALTGLVVMTAACTTEMPGSPTAPTVTTPVVTYPSSAVATVDCGEDGVANVDIEYGDGVKDVYLIGRSSTGGEPTLSQRYGTTPELGEATLTVTTSPTRGTCRTTLTDYESGNVVAERETAGRSILKVVVRL